MSLLDIAANSKPSPFLNSAPSDKAPSQPSSETSELVAAGEILLEIKDFQAHKHVKIGLKGFVAIRGESDLGKSAILRAMRAILANDWPSDYLRDGATESYISMTFPLETSPNVESIHFWKSSKKNEYGVKLRGKPLIVYPKIGKDIPQEVKDMGFAPVTSEKGDNFYLNFNKQASPWFLVSNSPMEKTSFFNAIFKIQKYEAANRSINSDAIQIHQKINLLTSQAQSKEIDLKNQKDLTTLLQKDVDSELALLTKATELEQKARQAEITSQIMRKEELSLEEALAIKDIMQSGKGMLEKLIAHLSKIKILKQAASDIRASQEREQSLYKENEDQTLASDQLVKETTLLKSVYAHAESRAGILRNKEVLADTQKLLEDLHLQFENQEALLVQTDKEIVAAGSMQELIFKKDKLTSHLAKVQATADQLKEAQLTHVKAVEGESLCVLAARMVNHEIQFYVRLQSLKGKAHLITSSINDLNALESSRESAKMEVDVRLEAINCLYKEQTSAESHLAQCPTCGSKVNAQHVHTLK